jgi:hypothetical protein
VFADRLPAEADQLLRREVDRVLVELARANPRALADNPEGSAIVGDALRQAMVLGLSAAFAKAGVSETELDFGADTWRRWQDARLLAPEGEGWPAALELIAPHAVDDARTLALAAGQELGLHGRALRRLGAAGEQAAEAGAALANALTEPASEHRTPEAATPAPTGARQPDGTVRVAVAANEAEAELVRSMLADAGIPSTWRRTGGDLPQLLAAGYREIYVPAPVAHEAQALLATVEAAELDDEPEPAHRVGLERTGLRLIGKATAAFIVLGLLVSAAIGLATTNVVLGVAALVMVLIAGAAIVVWSERSRTK